MKKTHTQHIRLIWLVSYYVKHVCVPTENHCINVCGHLPSCEVFFRVVFYHFLFYTKPILRFLLKKSNFTQCVCALCTVEVLHRFAMESKLSRREVSALYHINILIFFCFFFKYKYCNYYREHHAHRRPAGRMYWCSLQ